MDSRGAGIKQSLFAIAVLVIAALGAGAVWRMTNDRQVDEEHSPAAVALTVPDREVEDRFIVPEGWRAYQNTRFGFLLAYPSGMGVREVDEGAGAMTLTFQDIEKALGFQMFIVPYSESTISDERFLMDVPSGVRENIEDVTIDGIAAVAFDSSDAVLGPTKEVWFIRNGHLYEFTAPRSQAKVLSDILLTLDFTK